MFHLNHRDTESAEDSMLNLLKTLHSPCLRGEMI